MRLNGKFVAELDENDILQVVEDRRAEDQNLEFKRDTYGKSDSEKRELLKDVLGLANSSGGVILVGVDEDGEIAVGAPGVELENARDPVERYERTIRDASEPMLTGFQIAKISLGMSGRFVIAIGVPASLSRPHRAKITTSGRWPIRRNRNTDDMTYAEIKNAFLDRESIEIRARNFHAARCQDVLSGRRQSLTGESGGVLVMHVAPLRTEGLKLDEKKTLPLRNLFFPPGEPNVASLRPDLEGVTADVSYASGLPGTSGGEPAWWGWVKVFRNGCAEGVMGNYAGLDGREGDSARQKIFNHSQFERDVMQASRGYIEGLVQLGFNPPFAVSVSILSGHGSTIRRPFERTQTLKSAICTLEPVIIETYQPRHIYGAELKSVFDQLWNAFGVARCPSFDDDGSWKGALPQL